MPDKRVIELHGNTTYAHCLGCRRRYELDPIREQFELDGEAPDCQCGGYIKTATISFGQAMPEAEMHVPRRKPTPSDLFVAVASSLVVYPAPDSLPSQAGRRPPVDPHREPTEPGPHR